MKTTFPKLALCFSLIHAVAFLCVNHSHADESRDRLFDSEWRFLRADASGAENPTFDDSQWRVLDLPHDWSIEDLPAKKDAVPEFSAVGGQWRFQPGDAAQWKESTLDDSDWQQVTLPDNWERHSNHTGENVYGWFRRRIDLPEICREKDFDLLLGRIDEVDEAWLNGERIGGTGSFPPKFLSGADVIRRYRVPTSLVKGDGSDVLAVRVFDKSRSGGMLAEVANTGRIGPFDPVESLGAEKTGYVVGGVGWYRKHFTIDDSLGNQATGGKANKRVTVRFDGVYMNSDVWINGHWLGNHPYGYTNFEFDLTSHLNSPGEQNVLAVRVRNEGKNSRWYSGSGIYRHTWLTTTDPIHVPTSGVFVSTPEVSKERSLVKVAVDVRNDSPSETPAIIRTQLRDAAGEVVNRSESELNLPAGQTSSTWQSVEVPSPMLWSPDSPNLYWADIEVVVGEEVIDKVTTRFGIRKIEFDTQHGFRLNGENVLLKGGCVHHDNGPLGAAAIDRAEERKVELLKASGYNALRSSHNPASPAMLDACDRHGMLMINESFDQWNESKKGNDQDYHVHFDDWAERDIAAMVRADRNHPSIIMWSIGNEIPEQFHAEATQKRLRDAVLSHDTTRPVTQAICSDWGNVERNWDALSDPAFLHLDVSGYNYLPEMFERDHARHPQRVMYCSESFPKEAFKYWSLVEKHPYVIGDFVWTAMDYFGESGIGHSVFENDVDSFFMTWPWYNAWCGDLDVCGFKKPQSYYRDVLWSESQIELAVHAPIPLSVGSGAKSQGLTERVSLWGWRNESRSWNWPGHEATPLQVSVYSRCDTVRLELNGMVIGEKPVSDETKLTATFDVPYESGELRALGLVDGKVVAKTSIKTSGKATKLKLTADRSTIRADHGDLCYVAVEVVDQLGQRVPDVKIPVRFSVSGVGELAAQASGSPNDPASFRVPVRKTFEGRCLAILRPYGESGEITLHAEADGLEPASITVQTQ